MVGIRGASPTDLLEIRNSNLVCLPENYQFKYFLYHCLSWPQLIHLAEDCEGRVQGYVLSKLGDDEPPTGKKSEQHGHITSLAVHRSMRKLGLATSLMRAAHDSMENAYLAKYCSLHVRVTNRAAYSLYHETLGYQIHNTEIAYYADKENAFNMKFSFKKDEVPDRGK